MRRSTRPAVQPVVWLLIAGSFATGACSRIKPTPDAGGNGAGVAVHATPCALPATEDSLVGAIADVPEYHDCQRVLAGSSGAYGPLIGIFVTERFVKESEREAEVEGLYPKALIHNFGPGEYTVGSVTLPVGYSCLWMTATPRGWEAHITFAGQTVVCDASAKPATIVATHPPAVHAAFEDYPPVARWEWDPAAQRHYIGIKCGADWCELGGSGEAAPAAGELPAFTPVTGHPQPSRPQRVHQIKGWYDEQRLAEAEPASAGSLRPGPLARVYPHPQLDQLTLVDFAHWVPVASVYLAEASDKYAKTLNLQAGMNEIALCQGSQCGAPADLGCSSSLAATGGEPALTWYARIVAKGHPEAPRYRCVTKQQHPGVRIPGTARWRWSDDDEKIWIRCTNGCCTVS